MILNQGISVSTALEKPLLITQGDPAGIGPELVLMGWMDRQKLGLPPFALIADPAHIAALAKQLDWTVPIREVSAEDIGSAFSDALPVIPIKTRVNTVSGQADPATAPATVEAIETAVSLTMAGKAAAFVTNPVAKYVLYDAGFQHRGSDEFLASLAEQHTGLPTWPVLMFWSEILAVVPVTVHVPVADIPLCLTSDIIVSTGMVVSEDLSKRFGINRPRIAITGLNPHAGENGKMGTEDRDIITPAITLLRRNSIDARGPYSADSLFHARARAGYDVVVAMYHDQALIPIKTLAFDSAVNVTLGLPFIRTAPNHGTAFDIAGRGIGNPRSLISAIRLADRLARTQNQS